MDHHLNSSETSREECKVFNTLFILCCIYNNIGTRRHAGRSSSKQEQGINKCRK